MEVHEGLVLCTERKSSALQHTRCCTIIFKGMRKNILFYTCDVLLSSIGSCFSSLSCTGPLVLFPGTLVYSLSCTDSSQPPCRNAPPVCSKGSSRWGLENMENMSGGTSIRPHCLVTHLLLEIGTSGRDFHSHDLSWLHVCVLSNTFTNYRFFLIVPNGTGYLKPSGCFRLCEQSGKNLKYIYPASLWNMGFTWWNAIKGLKILWYETQLGMHLRDDGHLNVYFLTAFLPFSELPPSDPLICEQLYVYWHTSIFIYECFYICVYIWTWAASLILTWTI